MYTIIYTDINNKTNVKSLQKPPIFFWDVRPLRDLSRPRVTCGSRGPRPTSRVPPRSRRRVSPTGRQGAPPPCAGAGRAGSASGTTRRTRRPACRRCARDRTRRRSRRPERTPPTAGAPRPSWGNGRRSACATAAAGAEGGRAGGEVTVRGEQPDWSCGEGESGRRGLLSGENNPTGAVRKEREGRLLSRGTECWEREGRITLKVPQGKGRTGWSGLLSGGTQCWEREGRVTLKVLQSCGEEKGRGWEGREVILSGYPSSNLVDENVF